MRSEQDGTPRCAQNRNPYAMAWPKLRNAAVALTPTTPWQALAGGNAHGRGRRNRGAIGGVATHALAEELRIGKAKMCSII